MIIIEKTAKNVSEAIDMIIGEVFGCRSEFAESVQKFHAQTRYSSGDQSGRKTQRDFHPYRT